MAADLLDNSRTAHPSPHRDRVSVVALAAVLIAPPLAWAAQLITSFALAAHACYPRSEPALAPTWAGLIGVLWAVSAASLVVGLTSAALSWRHWRLTRDEKPGSATGLVDAGEGRTRFLAMCGLIVGNGFALALLWTASSLLLVPACAGLG